LVFELRREVADLQFRLQATEENVASFLQILSSMHAELSSGPVEPTPVEAPAAATGEGMDRAQRPTEVEREKDERGSKAEETARDEGKEKQWADQPTYIEEEPWTEDLRATWIGYMPGV
jgi:hypothetical protein